MTVPSVAEFLEQPLVAHVATSAPRLVVDTCDLASGNVFQVNAAGRATVEPKDRDRVYRKLRRYLGPDRDRWPERFRVVLDDPNIDLVRLVPERELRVGDQSFEWPR